MEQGPLLLDQRGCCGAHCPTGHAEATSKEENEGGDDGEGEEREEGGEDAPIIPVVESHKSKKKTSKPDCKGKGIA